MKKVNFIIGGGQKCGTTALHAFLSKHPKIIASQPKEIDFFNFDTSFEKGYNFYHNHFRKPFLSSLRGFKFLESSPSYIISGAPKLTAERMYRYNPELKLIFLVRNPIDRAFSAYQMYKKRFYENNNNSWFKKRMKKKTGLNHVSATIRKDSDFESFDNYIISELKSREENRPIEAPVLSLGLYSTGIRKFKDVFGEQVLVIQNEHMRANTDQVLTQLNKFLEIVPIDWSFTKEKEIFAGNYLDEMSSMSRTRLQEFYFSSNKDLYDLTGIDYNQSAFSL